MKEHWTRKLKRELAEARGEVHELVRNPESFTSQGIRARVKFEDQTNDRIWAGSFHSGENTPTNGILHQMINSKA